MPTIQGIDSFQHRILPTAINTVSGWYSAIGNGGTQPNHGSTGITFDTTEKRTASHACSLKMLSDGVNPTNVRRTVATTMIVGSVYFKITALASGGKIVNCALSAGVISIAITSSGFLQLKVGSGSQTTGSTSYADSAWHRLDFKCDTTTGTATVDATVDGVTTAGQASLALASANMTTVMVGDNTLTTTGFTVYFSDLVWSVTSGDYPLGDHICRMLTPNGEGAHSSSANFQTESGGTSNFIGSVDDAWDGTTPELSQTGEDHVKQITAGASNYLEFTLTDPSEATVWGAQLGTLMASLDATTADNCNARLTDSGGNIVGETGLIDPSISATAYSAYRVYSTAAPAGGWSGTTLSACLLRWGFSTDVAPNPVMNASLVEYVSPWSAVVAGSLIYDTGVPSSLMGR